MLTNGPVLAAKEIGISKMPAMTEFQRYALFGRDASAKCVNCCRKGYKWPFLNKREILIAKEIRANETLSQQAFQE